MWDSHWGPVQDHNPRIWKWDRTESHYLLGSNSSSKLMYLGGRVEGGDWGGHACQYKRASKQDFKAAFDHLFPRPEHKTSAKVQNYLQCQYYVKWKEICATTDVLTANAIHSEIKRRVFRFGWLPHATQDRMWITRRLKGFSQYPPGSSSNAVAPCILVRGQPEW